MCPTEPMPNNLFKGRFPKRLSKNHVFSANNAKISSFINRSYKKLVSIKNNLYFELLTGATKDVARKMANYMQ